MKCDEVFAAHIALVRPQIQMFPSVHNKREDIVGNVLALGTDEGITVVNVKAVSLILAYIPRCVVAFEACEVLDVSILAEDAVLRDVADGFSSHKLIAMNTRVQIL